LDVALEVRPLGNQSRARQALFVYVGGREKGGLPIFWLVGLGLGSSKVVGANGRIVGRVRVEMAQRVSSQSMFTDRGETAGFLDIAIQLGQLRGISLSFGPSYVINDEDSAFLFSLGAVLNPQES